MKPKLSREQLRNKLGNQMCREVRYQIANNIHDEIALFAILEQWMKVAKKDKYERP